MNSSISSSHEAQSKLLFVSISSSNLLNPKKGGNGEKVGVLGGVDIMILVLMVAKVD